MRPGIYKYIPAIVGAQTIARAYKFIVLVRQYRHNKPYYYA